MDRISLKNMCFFGFHGCHESEKEQGQRFEVDVDLFSDLSRPGESDCLADSVDYVGVYQQVKQIVETEKFNLLERLAWSIADSILACTDVLSVEVRVRKPGAVLGGVFDTVEVSIFRSRK